MVMECPNQLVYQVLVTSRELKLKKWKRDGLIRESGVPSQRMTQGSILIYEEQEGTWSCGATCDKPEGSKHLVRNFFCVVTHGLELPERKYDYRVGGT